MVKIIGILAIVLVCYCAINAEIDNLQIGKSTTEDARKQFTVTTMKTRLADNISDVNPNLTDKAHLRAKFATGFPEDFKGPLIKFIIKIGETPYNDLEQLLTETRGTNQIYRDENQNEKKDSESNKPKKKWKHYRRSGKHKDTEKVDYKDNYKHQMHKKLNKEEEENEEKDSESKKPKKKKNHYYNSKKHDNIDNKDRKHQNDKKHDKAVDENEEKESESNEPKKKKHHHSENHEDTKETDYKDRKHKKDKKRNKEGNNAVKRNKLINSLENDDKHTEKSIDLVYDTGTENTTRSYQSLVSGMRQEIKKITFKGSKKEQTAAEKEVKRLANVAAAALQVQSMAMASSKDPKLQPEASSKQVLLSTTTPKPQPKPVQKRLVNRTLFKNTVALRTHKKKHEKEIRATRMVPLSLNKLYNKEMKKIQGEVSRQGNKSEIQKNPSHLSPYAIIAQMEELMNEFPEVNATITKFARTAEYNDIVLVTVNAKNESAERYLRAKESKYAEDVPEKKIIFIVHGLTVMGMKGLPSLVQMSELKLLLSYYFKHLDKFDIYLMPLANPDGYSASRSSDRTIWNKNVSPQSECPGVFVDRNFDVAWNVTREISSCSQLYPGAKPFSEVESKAVRDVFHRFSHKILAYIHVHSGTFDEKVFKGDAILYPRGYTEIQSDDDKYIDLKGEIDEVMKNASFRVMSVTVDTLANWYGVVAGSSVDYASAVYGIPYAFEFVMQIYDTATLNNNALTEIWSRLIDTTFNNMWKSLHHASAERTQT